MLKRHGLHLLKITFTYLYMCVCMCVCVVCVLAHVESGSVLSWGMRAGQLDDKHLYRWRLSHVSGHTDKTLKSNFNLCTE